MSRRMLILTEAGDGIGFGHLTRCQAIQQAAVKNGWSAEIGLQLEGKHQIQAPGVRLVDWRQSEAETICPKGEYELLLVDSYLAEAACYAKLSTRVPDSIAIDDFNRIIYPTRRVLNLNPFYRLMSYKDQTAWVKGGVAYTVLRPEFGERKCPAELSGALRRILLTVGGSDLHNLIPRILREKKHRPDVKWEVACGNNELAMTLGQEFPGVQFHGLLNAAEMRDVFCRADLVICGCGQTLHELAGIGRPAIGILIGADQELNRDWYLRIGYLKETLHWRQADLTNCLDRAIDHLDALHHRMERLDSVKGMIPSDGAQRILEWLDSSLRNLMVSPEFSSRPAEPEDEDLLFIWVNDPGVRASALKPAQIPYEVHQNWFRRRLSDPDCSILIFESEGQAAGQLRLESENGRTRIDFSVDPLFRGRGFGTRILKEAVKMHSDPDSGLLYGEVLADNEPSLAAFRSAGFSEMGEIVINSRTCILFEFKA